MPTAVVDPDHFDDENYYYYYYYYYYYTNPCFDFLFSILCSFLGPDPVKTTAKTMLHHPQHGTENFLLYLRKLFYLDKTYFLMKSNVAFYMI